MPLTADGEVSEGEAQGAPHEDMADTEAAEAEENPYQNEMTGQQKKKSRRTLAKALITGMIAARLTDISREEDTCHVAGGGVDTDLDTLDEVAITLAIIRTTDRTAG